MTNGYLDPLAVAFPSPVEAQIPGGHLNLVIFLVGGEKFALPLDNIRRFFRMAAIKSIPNSPDHILGAINLAGVPYPVIDLHRVLKKKSEKSFYSNRLIQYESRIGKALLIVEDVLEILEISPDQLKSPETLQPESSWVVAAIQQDNQLIPVPAIDQLLQVL